MNYSTSYFSRGDILKRTSNLTHLPHHSHDTNTCCMTLCSFPFQHCSDSCEKCPCEEGDESDHCEHCEVRISKTLKILHIGERFSWLHFGFHLSGMFILLPLPHTVWHNLHSRLMPILHKYIHTCILKSILSFNLCIHSFIRWPCWWTNWIPLSVSSLSGNVHTAVINAQFGFFAETQLFTLQF